MNILIVSFDKNLVSKIKEVLGEHNVVDVKNGEEAMNTISSYMDVIIYDAVSGSISEEDINNMYKQKFKDSKYIILVDDLFPVDMNNITPPRKIKLMRDEAIAKVKDAILSEPEAVVEEHLQEMFLGEKLPLEDMGVSQPTYAEDAVGFREFDIELPTEPAWSQVEEIFQKGEKEKLLKKLLLVSFDTTLIKNIREALSEKVEILEARNIKEALEKAKEVDIILFDTISGMLAYRTLMDMSKDESLAKKPYVLLIDELFTIDVGSIPLERKYSFARESELSKAIEKVLELTKEILAERPAEPLLETYSLEESLPLELQPTAFQEEDKGIMGLLEEIMVSGFEEENPTTLAESFEFKKQEEPTIQENIMPFQSPMQTETEWQATTPSFSAQAKPSAFEYSSQTENITETISTLIKEAIKSQLSRDMVYSVLSQIIRPEEIGRQVSSLLERELEAIIGQKIAEALSRIDITQIVREEAYKVLRERLNELIT